MNREILFRGKLESATEADGKWVYGLLTSCGIKYSSINGTPVYTHTVGQFTGLLDKQGVRIFEGDIVLIDCKGEFLKHTVIWSDEIAAFRVMLDDDLYGEVMSGIEAESLYEVIGNIHDNPELMEDVT